MATFSAEMIQRGTIMNYDTFVGMHGDSSSRAISVGSVRKIDGYHGTVTMNGIVIYESTDATDERADAVKAADDRVAQRFAKMLAD